MNELFDVVAVRTDAQGNDIITVATGKGYVEAVTIAVAYNNDPSTPDNRFAVLQAHGGQASYRVAE